MKTSTILLLAAAGIGAVILYERTKPQPTATSPWVQLGAGLGGIVTAGQSLWSTIKGSSASSGYDISSIDHQDDTIVPDVPASSSRSVPDLTHSTFSKSIPSRDSISLAV